MKTRNCLLIILIFICSSFVLSGQNQELDSLLNLYYKANHDTTRIILLNEEIGYSFERKHPDSAIYYYEKAISIANKNLIDASNNSPSLKITFQKLKANSLRYIGIVLYESGTFDQAIKYVLKSLEIYEQLIAKDKDKKQIIDCKNGMTRCFIPLGNIQYDQGNFDKALEYYFKALKIHEELGNIQEKSGCYVNIGNVYYDEGLLDKSNEFYLKALKIAEELDDKKSMSKCYNNIGNLLLSLGKYDEGIEYYLKSLKIKEEFDDQYGIAMVNANIAQLHVLIADSLYPNASTKRNEHLQAALNYGLKAIEIARKIKAVPLENPAANTLMSVYKNLKNYQKGLEYAEVYIATKDSMFKEEKMQAVTNAEKRFESEKKQLLIDKLNKEKELTLSEMIIQKEQSNRQKMVTLFVIIGLILVVAFAVFLTQRLRISRRQKRIISEQKIMVDEKNTILNQQIEEISTQRDEIEAQRDLVTLQKDQIEVQNQRITDSINYAKRIQEAVLLSGESASKVLGEHFILFKPKDIVSGDFYWATRINEWLIVTVVDCTGHGVPGAFMSMLGVSFLNEIVRKKEVTEASDVLNILRESIIEALQQKGHSGEQKDGMDIALCVINTETNLVQFAGANNPLYIIKAEVEAKAEHLTSPSSLTLIELKGDKQPVAIYENMKPYTNHLIQLEKGDCIYLCSDGYEDQFGDQNNRKFMSKQLKELLVSIADKPMTEQGEILNTTFESWKGKYEQIDDVTILGIRV
ncbi:MAG: hypothetical protein CVU05_12980 [Bacteroidetes bacterium HGW-Bacteroidetes-21]|nr:MAG: hypothetical protein CVU05_12980 [Bacteroidetes bacterium HGW-Bacteroidetes-21]